jgi:uncharacterized protein YbaR (Trm112 family)
MGATPNPLDPVSQPKPSQDLDPELLAILACPATHQPLAVADAELLAGLNERIAAGGVKSVGGEAVEVPLEAGLVRQDRQVVYPIRDAIPVLLVDEGIAL